MADTPGIEARRAAVAAGLVARKSYRTLASELGVSHSQVNKDVNALRKEWAKERGETAEVFEQSLADLNTWQNQLMLDLPNLPAERRSGAIDTLLRLNDQRLKLHGLYPKAGNGDEPDIPTGPITIQFEMINAGNSRLVRNSQELDIVEYGALGKGGQQ